MAASNVRRIALGTTKMVTSSGHEAAVGRALELGIRHIDTSPTYGRGSSCELMLGHVLNTQKLAPRQELFVSSKVGYVASHTPPPDSVCVGDRGSGLHYTLHPETIEASVAESLGRLKLEYLDCVYVTNPEQYVADVLLKEGEATAPWHAKGQRSKMRRRLVGVFEALERLAARGWIRGYGVSSNGLAMPVAEPLHVSLTEITEAAAEASGKAGRLVPALRAVQLPINLLEPTGLSVAQDASAKGLEVVAVRPLTAIAEGGLYRMVDLAAGGEPPAGYVEACRDVLEYFNPPPEVTEKPPSELSQDERDMREGCEIVQGIIRDLNRQLQDFTSLTHYETELERRVIPYIYNTFEELDDEAAEKLQAFFQRYGEMVRYTTAGRVRELVCGDKCPTGPHSIAEDTPLHAYAIRWLLSHSFIGHVCVGMHTVEHMEDIAHIART